MEETVNRLQEAAQQLPRDDRHQLGSWVMEWEEKYGKNPALSPAPEPPPEKTTPSPPQISVKTPPPQPLQPAKPTAFGTRYLDPSKIAAITRTPEPPPISCAHCGTPNPAVNTICRSCGQSLRAKPAAPTRRLSDSIPPKAGLFSEFFSMDTALIVTIRGIKAPLEGYPREKMIIGRGFSPVPGQAFLDLSPYDGESLGVSRYHAELRTINNTLVITDLDSDNGTFINEVRVYPYEIRVLHNNDELRVGKLVMRLNFRPPTPR